MRLVNRLTVRAKRRDERFGESSSRAEQLVAADLRIALEGVIADAFRVTLGSGAGDGIVPWKKSTKRAVGDPSLDGKTALSLRGKPFPLQFLDERGAVYLEQLGSFAGDPVGPSKRANDEAVLELFEFS